MDRTEPSFAPLELEPRGPLAMAARLWRSGQNRNATIVVKATLTLVAKGVAALTEPEPVLADDVWSAGGVLLALNELAPYLPGADILLTADAHAPTPTPIRRARARLLVKRGQERLVDKTLFVLGDLAATGEIVPFVRIGLAYDRAVGGRDNPLGRAQPGVIDPSRPEAPAGFGPIPGSWPVRARLRGKADTRALEASIAELPTDLDAAYFHAAPPDQRVERLVGDETIELTGMHPRHEKFETRLPALRASLLVGGESVPLRLDTLRIDLSNERCYLLWRAIVPLEDEALKAIGTIERRDPVARAAAVRAVMATGPLDSERAPTLPFPPTDTAVRVRHEPIAGAPWSPVPATAVPISDDWSETLPVDGKPPVLEVPTEPAPLQKAMLAAAQTLPLIDVETRLYGPAAPFPLADAPDSAVPRKQVTQDEPAPSEEPSPGEQFLAARPRRGVLTDDKTKKSKKKS